MTHNTSCRAGRHFLQIPGPTSVPDRVLRAIDTPMIDYRRPEFARLTLRSIGHLGDTNYLTMLAALAGAEMTLGLAGVPHRPGGVQQVMTYIVLE